MDTDYANKTDHHVIPCNWHIVESAHAVLVTGLYALLGNLIEPPGSVNLLVFSATFNNMSVITYYMVVIFIDWFMRNR
jgi:hypothetical protein